MSLNDKYIINGSTLSDIGDALRGIYGETSQVNETVVVCTKSVSVSSLSTSTTETFNFNYIFGNSGVGFNNYGIEDSGYIRLQSISGGFTVSKAPIKENVYAFPFTVTVNGRNNSARMYCYPVDENLDYIIYDSATHKPDAYGYSYHRDITVTKRNTFLVEDIASKIQTTKIALITPFTIAGYSNYNSNPTNSTYMGDYISSIEDIEKLIVIQGVTTSPVLTIGELVPKNNDTTTGTLGNFGSVTFYRMRYKTFSGTSQIASTWEADIASSSSSNLIYFDQSQKRLINASHSTNAIVNQGFPAILIYK